MREWAFEEFQDSGLIYYLKKWGDIYYMSDWSYDITGSGEHYYIVLVNNALLTGREVDIDLSVDYQRPSYIPNIFWNMLTPIISIIVVVVIISVAIILVRKHKRKTPEEVIIIQEKEAPKIIYCRECGADILDKTRMFCSKCGAKIIN